MKIDSLLLHALRSNEHFQFVTDVWTIVAKLPEGAKARFADRLEIFAATIADEDTVLKKIMKSTLTAHIHEADAARDSVYRGMVDAVKSFSNHFNPAARAAAERVMNTIRAYGNVAAKGEVEETSALANLLRDLRAKHADDAQAMGLTPWIEELETRNRTVEEMLLDRDVEIAGRPTEAMKTVRRRTDEAYRNVAVCVEALAMMEAPEAAAAIAVVIAEMNATIARYDHLVAQRRGRAAAKDKPAGGGGKPGGDGIEPMPMPDVPQAAPKDNNE